MKKEFDYLKIYRRILGIWFRIHTTEYINFLGDDAMDTFRKYRDVYGEKYGKKNVMLRMMWNSEDYTGDGKVVR